MGRSKIPEGWLDYSPMKDVFLDARIIPIKVPLPINRFQDPAMLQHRWTPADVLQRIPNLGLIIDTTFKKPAYYEPYEFTGKGVKYVKIPCAGLQLPSQDVYGEFYRVVKSFLEENKMNDKVIALHCTHGINRTGYLLCKYLVENLSYTPGDALRAFALKRGYPVGRENYTAAVHQLGSSSG